jgi:hypothetical protein
MSIARIIASCALAGLAFGGALAQTVPPGAARLGVRRVRPGGASCFHPFPGQPQ